MKAHLIDLFRFQDVANGKMIPRLAELPQPQEAIKLMSHLIHSQDKWLARLRQEPDANAREWFGPSFALDAMAAAWATSVAAWIAYLEGMTEDAVLAEVTYAGPNGKRWAARLCDIALQLNFHGVHHRAQIQTMFREQGLTPDFIDYIGTRFREVQ